MHFSNFFLDIYKLRVFKVLNIFCVFFMLFVQYLFNYLIRDIFSEDTLSYNRYNLLGGKYSSMLFKAKRLLLN